MLLGAGSGHSQSALAAFSLRIKVLALSYCSGACLPAAMFPAVIDIDLSSELQVSCKFLVSLPSNRTVTKMPVSTYPALQLHKCTTMPRFLHGSWEIKLRFSGLRGNHFTA